VLYKVRTETGHVHIVQESAYYTVNIVYSLRSNPRKNEKVLSRSEIVPSWLSSEWAKEDWQQVDSHDNNVFMYSLVMYSKSNSK
jgi:hypothetical protein